MEIDPIDDDDPILHILSLPNEIIIEIFLYIDYFTILHTIVLTNQKFFQLTENEFFFKSMMNIYLPKIFKIFSRGLCDRDDEKRRMMWKKRLKSFFQIRNVIRKDANDDKERKRKMDSIPDHYLNYNVD